MLDIKKIDWFSFYSPTKYNSITLHRLDLYEKAQTHLEKSKELNPNEKTLVTWLRKNQDKLPKVEEVKVQEAAPVAPAPVAPKVGR